ncbi:PfkB family carbohydrate kinase [Peptoniphilus equinus]|uniref:PfkB family carbohydrate kinase n=1 Tax=Peptoniphilus equinus TaxID=3016343 RepID=A0ABY7QWA8_9FIRM|nr:PfkB family carbohydrate kinase [Peptoniphilus equinus]WBW50550.1 PfkB family carbohydrate kinase [Peptoniphilus equinus]
MTPRESEIMELIKKTPTITQQEIADILDIKRSSVAVHINNLSKQGYILGRRYIVRAEPYICVIGGANMDIIGYPEGEIIQKDSNPGSIRRSTGGVGHNIAVNLAKLGAYTSFITALGNDQDGDILLQELKEIGIDVDHLYIMDKYPTSTYLAILNEHRDMEFAINDMKIIEELTPKLIFKRKKRIENAEFAVLDTNLSHDTINYILKEIRQKYYVDCVSVHKAKKIESNLNRIYFLKCNKIEAEYLAGMTIDSIEDGYQVCDIIMRKGVETLVVTMGDKGLIYSDMKHKEFLASDKVDVMNVSGAGDAFMAGYIYADFNGFSLDKKLKMAMAMSRHVLQTEETTIDAMAKNSIKKEMELC